MTFQQIRHRADQLRRIPLLSVLHITGAQQDQHDKAKWHTPQGALSVNGMKFINWNLGVGGGGAKLSSFTHDPTALEAEADTTAARRLQTRACETLSGR